MFARGRAEVRRELEEQTRALLRARSLVGLCVLLGADLVFAIGDLALSPGRARPLLGIKVVQIGFLLFGLSLLRRPLSLDRLKDGVLLLAASNCVLSAVICVIRESLVTLPLVNITLAMAAATLLPWGARAQAALVVSATVSAVWALHQVAGIAAALDYPVIAMMIAFAVSVYVAHAFDQYRLAIESRNLELLAYRDVVHNANDAILTFDGNCRVTGVNPAAGAMFGAAPGALLDAPLERLFAAEDAGVLRQRWAEVLTGRGRTAILSLDAMRSDGSSIPIEVKARAIGGEGNAGIQAILRDVTEKRIVEQMRNDFVAMLSHDLKTPLVSILGFAEMLAEELHEQDQCRLVERIEANARVAHALAADFVDVARIESGSLDLQLENTSLNDIVDRVLRHQECMARAREISIDTALAENLPDLALDRAHIHRVIANLVTNAIKFSPIRGCILVRTACEKGRVVLRVRDQGPGIPADQVSQLFERYRRLGGRRAEGTGLGLYIVKQIVQAHGGSVEVACPPDGGSIFQVSFEPRILAA